MYDLGARGGQTTVDENGVIIDLDEKGAPTGYEFLCVSTHAIALDALPQAVGAAVQRFIDSGALEVEGFVERTYGEAP